MDYKKDHEKWFAAINDFLSKKHGVTLPTLRNSNRYNWELAYCVGLTPGQALEDAVTQGLELPKKKRHPNTVELNF
jgi:hypothetical protein